MMTIVVVVVVTIVVVVVVPIVVVVVVVVVTMTMVTMTMPLILTMGRKYKIQSTPKKMEEVKDYGIIFLIFLVQFFFASSFDMLIMIIDYY
jgi:hypothetical protein